MRLRARFVGILASIAVASTAHASPIGTIDVAGLGNASVSVATIDFGPPGGGVGAFLVTAGDGSFAVVPPGSVGTIADLDLTLAPPGPPLGTPVTPFLVAPNPGALFAFDLRQIALGGGAPCTVAPGVGGSCSPSEIVANTPLLLTQTSTGVAVSFSVNGVVFDLTDGSSAPYAGLFTMNLTRSEQNTVPEVLAALATPDGGGTFSSSWSAEFTVVPEPGTTATLALGLATFAARRARRSDRAGRAATRE